MKMKIQLIKICGMPGKQCLEGSLETNAYIRKEDSSQINNLTFHLKKLEKKRGAN